MKTEERIVAVVPLRSLRVGKTRLSPVLGDEERAALMRQVAEWVIRAALDSGVVETVLVVSPEPETLAWASGLAPGVVGLPQSAARPGLNEAIAAGRQWAAEQGADAMVSLFADLPLLTAEEIRALAARPEPVVLGPDRRGEGTNVLLLRLPGLGSEFRFGFGTDSLAQHREEAERLGITIGVQEADGIGFDLDTPQDWSDFLAAAAGSEADRAPALARCTVGAG